MFADSTGIHDSFAPAGQGWQTSHRHTRANAATSGFTGSHDSGESIENGVYQYRWQYASASAPKLACDYPKYERRYRRSKVHLQVDHSEQDSNDDCGV